jgi:hypothetical protein
MLFTDEATCTQSDITSHHVWADKNLNEIISGHHQERLSISVWAIIIGDELEGITCCLHDQQAAIPQLSAYRP